MCGEMKVVRNRGIFNDFFPIFNVNFDSPISTARLIPATDNRNCVFLLSVSLNPIVRYWLILSKCIDEMPIGGSPKRRHLARTDRNNSRHL
jgi:hypothetical protein